MYIEITPEASRKVNVTNFLILTCGNSLSEFANGTEHFEYILPVDRLF